MRIAIGGIIHETSTFVRTRTTRADFESNEGTARGNAILQTFDGANVCTGGFLEGARQFGFKPVPLLRANAWPGGLILRADCEALREELCNRLRQADAEQRLDGALLDLHGAMVVEGIDDGDGDVVAAVRAILGPDRPIVFTQVVARSDGRFAYDGPMFAGLRDNPGPSAWLQIEGVAVVVVTGREQPFDMASARSPGIDCRRMRHIALKSAAHFRAAFEPIAGSIYNVDAARIHTHVFRDLKYQKLTRPVFPVEIPPG